MPILAAEPDRYPSHLFDGPAQESSDGRNWFVLHTKPRQEKSLARHLYATGVSHYLPAVPRRCRIRNRVLTAHVPLFTGYLFLFADGEERVSALASNRIAHTLPVTDQPR